MEEIKIIGGILLIVIIGGFLLYTAGRLFGKGFVESLKNFFKHKEE